jgi:hypothetical protein
MVRVFLLIPAYVARNCLSDHNGLFSTCSLAVVLSALRSTASEKRFALPWIGEYPLYSIALPRPTDEANHGLIAVASISGKSERHRPEMERHFDRISDRIPAKQNG